MKPGETSRRTFLKAGVVGAASATLTGCPPTKPPDHPVPPGNRVVVINGKTVFIRRRLSSWTDQDVASYRNAIQVMQARPISDPTSWLFQANIHWSPASDGSNPGWNKCPHHTPHFLSWHRMYLYFWEKIVRKASGDPEFSIGYWRYEDTVPESLSLPEPFRTPTSGNPLYMSTRNSAVNGGSPIPASAVVATTAMAQGTLLAPPDIGFSEALGSSPHDNIHVQVGTGSGMGSVTWAARDPIFFAHHANIDRYWKRWLDDASHENPSSGDFLTTVFQFFDDNGAPVTMTGADVLNTVDQLSYKYDDDPAPTAPSAPRIARAAPPRMAEPKVLATGPVPRYELSADKRSFAVALTGEAPVAFQSAVKSAGAQRLFLNLEDAAASAAPDVSYEVYVNLPDPPPPNVDYKSPHFVGTFSLFGAEHNHPGHPQQLRVSLDITPALTRLSGLGKVGDQEVRVTFIPIQAGAVPGARVQTQVVTSFGKMTLVAR